MFENENLVTEVTENVETATEETVEQVETPKTYTSEEVDQIVGKKLGRQEVKIRKEYERTYGPLETVLKAGTGKENIGEITEALKEFYAGKGVNFSNEPSYSAKDIELLAKADADDIISSGFDEVVEEADRLNALGVENMSAREKAVFIALAEHIRTTETNRELAKIGVTEDVYNSKEFKNFAGKFAKGTPMTDIYDIYSKIQPKKEIQTMGSMKNSAAESGGVKDFYSREEALKFTQDEINKNPALLKAIENSMQKW